MFIAVCLLVLAAAALGQFQDWLRLNFPRAPSENVFYVHLLSLPMFLGSVANLSSHAAMWNSSATLGSWLAPWFAAALHKDVAESSYLHYAVDLLLSVPSMWIFVAVNIVTQCVLLLRPTPLHATSFFFVAYIPVTCC